MSLLCELYYASKNDNQKPFVNRRGFHSAVVAVPKLEINSSGDRFENELPLLNRAGNTIGAVGVVFAYKNGDDKLQNKADQVREALRDNIPSIAKLLGVAH